MAVITISRELGSQGNRIVDLLCEKLGYCRVDKAVLTQIAEEAGVDVKAILDKERAVTSKPRLISDQMTSLYGRAPSAFGRSGNIDDQTYARVVQETMERFAREGDTVIAGRGGQMVLRDWPTALHIHIYAPEKVRIRRLRERLNISELDAKRRIAGSDERKRWYIRQMHRNANWKDLKHYHLTINTGRISVQTAAEIIIQAAQSVDAAAAQAERGASEQT
jgi:cytidylate kinase